MMGRRTALTLMVAGALVAGCGAGSGQHQTNGATGTSTEKPEGGTTATGRKGSGGTSTSQQKGGGGTGTSKQKGGGGAGTSAQTNKQTDYLKHHDVNRGDVANLLSLALPSLVCGSGEPNSPLITVLGTMDIQGNAVSLGTVRVCLSGFNAKAAVDALITFPDGATKPIPVVLDNLGRGGVAEEELSSGGAGRYAVTVVDQGDSSKTASATFWRGEFTISPQAAPAGTTFVVRLAGFPLKLSVPIYLYEATPCLGGSAGCWSFRAYLPVLMTDGTGSARLDLITQRDDKATSYCLMLGTVSGTTPCRTRFRVDAP